MSTRISSGVLLAGLAAACSPEQTANTQVLANVEAVQDQEAADDGLLNCAVGAAATLSRVCSVERQESDRGLILTVRHPDGGFRRLLVTKDGRGVVAAVVARSAQHQHIRSGRQATDGGGACLPCTAHHGEGAVTLFEGGFLNRAHVGGGKHRGTLDRLHGRFASLGFTVTGRR